MLRKDASRPTPNSVVDFEHTKHQHSHTCHVARAYCMHLHTTQRMRFANTHGCLSLLAMCVCVWSPNFMPLTLSSLFHQYDTYLTHLSIVLYVEKKLKHYIYMFIESTKRHKNLQPKIKIVLKKATESRFLVYYFFVQIVRCAYFICKRHS